MAEPLGIGIGYDEKIGQRPVAGQAQTEYFNKQSGQAFVNPADLANFANTLNPGKGVRSENVFNELSYGFKVPEVAKEIPAAVIAQAPPKSQLDLAIENNTKVRDQFLGSLAPSDAEQDLQKNLFALQNEGRSTQLNAQAGLNAIENQPIAMEFVTGQQAALQRQANLALQTNAFKQEPLLQNLQMLQQNRQANSDKLRSMMEFGQFDINLAREVQKDQAAQAQAAKELALKYNVNTPAYTVDGKTIYNTQTGKAYSTAAEFFTEFGFKSWDEVPQGFIQRDLVSDEERQAQRAYDLQIDQFGFNKTESNRNFALQNKELDFNIADKNRQYGLDVQKVDIDRMQAQATQNPNKLLSPDEASKFGLPYGATASDAVGLYAQKPPTEAQSKDAGYAQRVKDANAIISGNQEAIAKYNSAGYWAANKLPNALKPALIQSQDQAARNFINSILRRESGAAISPSEFDNAREQYLPKPGDKKDVLEQKARNRQVQLDNLKKSAGSAWQPSLDEIEGGLIDNPKGKARLGELSQKYESGGNPGAIGKDNTGGWSYGTYQLAHNNVNRFLQSTPQFGTLFKGLEKGSTAFNNKWKEVANKAGDAFGKAQHEFIAKTHFEPQVNKLSKLGIDINRYSNVLKDVVWSTAVQHGASNNVIANAINKVGKNASENTLIKAIYDERWSGGSRFASSTGAVKNAVRNRFFGKDGELATALNKLKNLA